MVVVSRVVLIGFSGSGKSSVARLLSERLDWQLVDTDADIERKFGVTVPEIFANQGEPFFRQIERESLLAGLTSEKVVIATGGGAVVDQSLWTAEFLQAPGTLVVALDAEPESILARLRRHHETEGLSAVRPMIAGDDPLANIRALKAKRQAVYDQAHITLVAEKTPPETLVTEIEGLVADENAMASPSLTLRTSSAISEIFIRPGIAQRLGAIARESWPKARKAWVISDEHVGVIHGEAILASLSATGFDPKLKMVPAGESSKSWSTCGELLDWMLDGSIERGDVVVALGGGVIGDLAGFAAASVLRGVPLIQIPTSLLAMVDSSIGGKTGINQRTGKNLIGAFYQPPVVLIDPAFLHTLPQRELNAGWAEIIKHAVIQISTPEGDRGDLLSLLERNLTNLHALREPAITYAITRNVGLKRQVVEADEKEQGIRAYLNFGHTLGHAIEASDYQLLHGEAIGIGMRAALRIALQLELTSADLVERVDHLISGFGLPITTNVDEGRVMQKMVSDKKRVAGTQRWVLPLPEGGVGIRTDVPESVVLDALRQVTTSI